MKGNASTRKSFQPVELDTIQDESEADYDVESLFMQVDRYSIFLLNRRKEYWYDLPSKYCCCFPNQTAECLVYHRSQCAIAEPIYGAGLHAHKLDIHVVTVDGHAAQFELKRHPNTSLPFGSGESINGYSYILRTAACMIR